MAGVREISPGMCSARRGLSLLAVASLFVLIGRVTPVSSHSLLVDTFVIASGLAMIIVLAIVTLTVPEDRLGRVDAAVLASGMLLQVAQFAGANSASVTNGTDETLLNRLAMRTILAGHNPYSVVYRLVGADGYGTPLLGGGQANRYAYPPLELDIGRVIGLVSHRYAAPSSVGGLALLTLGVSTFLVLPRDWRPMAVVSVLGLGLFETQALTGETVVLAMALLCLPLWRWTDTGAGGRLGRIGVLQAVSLGLAVAAGQLAWFVTLFLLLGVALVRRGELGGRRAAAVLSRYLAITALTFVIVNSPFIVADAGAWARAMTSTLTQHAIVAGSSWALPAIELHGGSDRIGLLSAAALLLLAASWLCFGAWFRRCARVLAVIPSAAFLLSSRSDPTYLFALVPLWLVTAATASPAAIGAAAPLRAPAWSRRAVAHRAVRVALTVAAVVPACVVFLVAVTGEPPLRLRPIAATLDGYRIATVTIAVDNPTGSTLRPQYFIDQRSAITHPWVPLTGDVALLPHERAVVELRTRTPLEAAPVSAGLWIFATVDSPEGMTASPLQIPARAVQVRGVFQRGTEGPRRRLCLAEVMAGRHYDCTTQLGLSAVSPGPDS